MAKYILPHHTLCLKQWLPSLPTKGLLLIYNSVFWPRLNYFVLAWGHLCDCIVKLQKREIHLISSTTFNAHSEALCKQLNILKLEDFLYLKAMKCYYRYSKHQLPRYIDNNVLCFTFYPFLWHQKAIYPSPSPLKKPHKNCIRFYILCILTKTPTNIKHKFNRHSYSGLSKYIKTYVIIQCSDICTSIMFLYKVIPAWMHRRTKCYTIL